MAGNVARSMSKMNAGLNKIMKVGGAALAGVTIATAKATLSFAKAGDEAAKTSRRIGMSAEAFQEFKFAADRAGVSGEDATKSLEKLNKNVGDLRAGTGALKTILDKSNPALAEQLKNAKNNEEAFNIMTGAINQLPNQMDKAALSQAAFGRSGLKMLTVMENGVDGLNDLRQEARKYGGIISNDAAKASEDFMDSLTNMKAALQGIAFKALGPLVKAFQPYLQAIADYFALNKKVIALNIEKAFKEISIALKNINPKTIIDGFKTLLTIFKKVNQFVEIIGGWETLIGIFASLVVVVKLFTIAMNIANIAMAANPVGLITIGIIFFISVIVIVIAKFETWGSVILTWISIFSPVYAIIQVVVNVVITLRKNWESITSSFKNGGFIEGMKTLGVVIVQTVLTPLMKVIQLLEKIPAIKKLGLSKMVGGVMDMNQNFIDRDNQDIQTQNKAQEIQNRYALAPNGQKAETEQTRAVMGAGTITVRAEEGTSATTDSGSMNQTGWSMEQLGKDGI